MDIQGSVMKVQSMIICAIFGMLMSLAAHAQEVDLLPVDDISKVPTGTDAAALATPVGFTPYRLLRTYNSKEKNHMTINTLPPNWGDLGWKTEGLLGYSSATPFADAHQIYLCYMTSADVNWLYKRFTSTDPNCEGWSNQIVVGYNLGWVANGQQPGSVPLYRCYVFAIRDHFDTLSATCEGVVQAVNEGVLGYVFL